MVSVRHAAIRAPDASRLDRVLAFESRRFGPSLASPAAALDADAGDDAEIVIDLTGASIRQGAPVLTLDFAGHRNFPGGVNAMLASRQLPELVARLDGVAVGRARPMIADRVWLSRGSTDLLAGAISLIEQSISRFAAGRLIPIGDVGQVRDSSGAGFVRHYLPALAVGLGRRAWRKLRLGRRPFYWQVGYRLIDGPGVAETGRLDGTPFTALPDDGQRFYADPFAFEHNGRHYIFVEEFPYTTGRGVVSVAELGADGRFETPRVVLEETHHLSYPQVFAHDGEVYMIPEGSAARELVLYRAQSFPDRWVRDTVLIADIEFNDATLLEQAGRYWLFGTQRRGRGSSSDTLAVYSAPSLHGPWLPHDMNPIAIDHSAARPGGSFVRADDKLLLPVQDGSQVYGGGLGLMELTRLGPADIAFAPPRPIGSGLAWSHRGIHTLNRVGRLEVIDSAG